MATIQEDNRKKLHNIIKNEFILSSTNKVLTYDEWFKIFFKNSNTFSEQSSTSDENGNVKYNNLFSIINFKKIVSSDDTIINYYFTPSASGYATWKNVLTKKQEFYKNFACDLDWAKSLNFCKETNNDVITNTDGYVGDYTTDNELIKKVRISKGKDENGEESLYLSSVYLEKIPQLKNYTISKLIPKSVNSSIFNISNESGDILPDATITFNSNGFVFDYKIAIKNFIIKATKEETKDSNDTTSTTKKKTKKDTDKDTTVDTDVKKPEIKIKTLRFNNDMKDNTPSKDCSDFPFTLGCVNTKIGDLNAKFFSGDRLGDKYTKEFQSILDNGGNFYENPNMEITKDLWNKLMNKNIIKESVKKVLKEYINKKK